MKKQTVLFALVFVFVSFHFFAQTVPGPMPSHSKKVSASVAGIEWIVPAKWTPQGERTMRVATYTIPSAPTDPEVGECAVFFFGSGQGGDVQTNINRWISQ